MKVEWIRCDKKLPEKSGQYWIYGPWTTDPSGYQLGVELAAWDGDSSYWWIDDMSFVLDHDEAPTHWACAVLPEPPKEEER